MKKNLILVMAILVTSLLIVSTVRKIASFNSTANRVEGEEERLEQLRSENEGLKRELEYKKSQRFAEEEIRNKLGLAKEGEEVFVVPGAVEEKRETMLEQNKIPNWKKWRILILGRG